MVRLPVAPRAGRDARRRAAGRRVRLPRGKLRRRLADPRRGPSTPAQLGRRPRARRADSADRKRAAESRTGQPAAQRRDARRRDRDRRRRRRGRRRQRAARARVAAACRGGAAARQRSGGGRRGNGRAYTPPPTAQSAAAGQALQQRAADPQLRRTRAGLRQRDLRSAVPRANQPRLGRAGHGSAREPAAKRRQRAIGQLVADHGAGAREHLAYQALGEWSADEREALRTLAAASPEVRAQALDDIAIVNGQSVGETPASGSRSDAALSEAVRGSVPDPASAPTAAASSPVLDRPAVAHGNEPGRPDRPIGRHADLGGCADVATAWAAWAGCGA